MFMKITIRLFLISVTCLCGCVPEREAEAVTPPPDGAYGTNTAEGQAALLNITSGTYHTAIGWYSLTRDMAGEFNTAIGAGALLNNPTGGYNTANGAFALV